MQAELDATAEVRQVSDLGLELGKPGVGALPRQWQVGRRLGLCPRPQARQAKRCRHTARQAAVALHGEGVQAQAHDARAVQTDRRLDWCDRAQPVLIGIDRQTGIEVQLARAHHRIMQPQGDAAEVRGQAQGPSRMLGRRARAQGVEADRQPIMPQRHDTAQRQGPIDRVVGAYAIPAVRRIAIDSRIELFALAVGRVEREVQAAAIGAEAMAHTVIDVDGGAVRNELGLNDQHRSAGLATPRQGGSQKCARRIAGQQDLALDVAEPDTRAPSQGGQGPGDIVADLRRQGGGIDAFDEAVDDDQGHIAAVAQVLGRHDDPDQYVSRARIGRFEVMSGGIQFGDGDKAMAHTGSNHRRPVPHGRHTAGDHNLAHLDTQVSAGPGRNRFRCGDSGNPAITERLYLVTHGRRRNLRSGLGLHGRCGENPRRSRQCQSQPLRHASPVIFTGGVRCPPGTAANSLPRC